MSTLVIVNVVKDGSPERFSDNLYTLALDHAFPGLREVLIPLAKIHKIREMHLYVAGELEEEDEEEDEEK